MAMLVLILWIIQGAVGLTLFLSWLRHARGRGARNVVTHLVMTLSGVAFHTWFTAAVYFTCLGVCVGTTVAAG